MCKQGLLVDPVKIALILSFPPPTNVNMLRAMLGHTGYYHKFIKGYVASTAPMKKILKKDDVFIWIPECQGGFDTLNAKLALDQYLYSQIGTNNSMCMLMHLLLC